MKRVVSIAALVLLAACGRDERLTPLTEWESADLQAAAFDFQVHPDAQLLPGQMALLRRAHFVIHPESQAPPPLAVYHVDAPLDEIAEFYAEVYGYQELEPVETPDAAAWYRSGELQDEVRLIEPLLKELEIDSDLSQARGTYRGAHISPAGNKPRVTLQRPWFDALESRVVDTTLIILARE